MNLAELAAFVCAKARKDDAASLSACKDFLKRRDQMLWDGHLWRDSIFEFTQAVDPGSAFGVESNPILATSGIVLLPRVIDRVLAMRSADNALPVEHVENYFRSSADAFAQSGTPLEFNVLSPVVWQFDTAQLVYIYNGVGSDGNIVIRFQTDTNVIKSASMTVAGSPQLVRASIYAIDRIVAIEEVSKPLSSNNVSFSYGEDEASQTAFLAALSTETRMEPYPRIRLLPTPTEALTLRALVKRKYQPFGSDYEEPRLRQSENVLIAYALGDMLQRSRQFGKARDCFAEGAALLEDLVSLEVDQQARNERLVPDVEPWPEDFSTTRRLKAYN